MRTKRIRGFGFYRTPLYVFPRARYTLTATGFYICGLIEQEMGK